MRDAMNCSRLVFAVILTLLAGTPAATEAGPGQPGPGRPVPETPFTATLWTPPLFGERFDCSAANVSAGNPDDVRGALQARDDTGGMWSAVHAR